MSNNDINHATARLRISFVLQRYDVAVSHVTVHAIKLFTSCHHVGHLHTSLQHRYFQNCQKFAAIWTPAGTYTGIRIVHDVSCTLRHEHHVNEISCPYKTSLKRLPSDFIPLSSHGFAELKFQNIVLPNLKVNFLRMGWKINKKYFG